MNYREFASILEHKETPKFFMFIFQKEEEYGSTTNGREEVPSQFITHLPWFKKIN